MTESLETIKEEYGEDGKSSAALKHPHGFPKNIERMFETFHQTPSGEFKPTFYNPFEIKHRRRTSKDQFQVLEGSFQENSKPNATVRRTLAGKLGMTPRAVQVWFQNRRAKMKMAPAGGDAMSPRMDATEEPDTPVPQSPFISSTGASTNCSSMASPEYELPSKLCGAAQLKKKGLGGRRHSMPNMAPVAPPAITNEHFKQLHEAIFGGTVQHFLTGATGGAPLNYQVPMKPVHSQSFDQHTAGYPAYYAPGGAYPPPRQRTASLAYPHPQHMQAHGAAEPPLEAPGLVTGHDLDYFLQSVIIPAGGAGAAQQQMFLSGLMGQADAGQLSGMGESLASFLCAGAAPPNGEPQQSDSYLLSKYMNDERFAD